MIGVDCGCRNMHAALDNHLKGCKAHFDNEERRRLVRLTQTFRCYLHRARGASGQTVHRLHLREYLLGGGLSLGRRLALGSLSAESRANALPSESEVEDVRGVHGEAGPSRDGENELVRSSPGVVVLVPDSQPA